MSRSLISFLSILTVLSVEFIAQPVFASAKIEWIYSDHFIEVNPHLFRGGRPSSQALEELKKIGVRTVIDLQGGDRDSFGGLAGLFEPGELPENIAKEHDAVSHYGMSFFNFPLNSMKDITPNEEKDINEALRIMNDPASQPVFIHCEHGKDRTGLLVALYRVFYQSWPAKTAHDEMLELGHGDFGHHCFTNALDKYFYRVTGMLPEED